MTKELACHECGAILDDPADQSDPMRRRFFAIVRAVWKTLPDALAKQYPSPVHLRKAALCRVGWCESKVTTCGNRTSAIQVAALVSHLDRYAIVDITGSVVTVFTARSLRKRGCPKKTFSEVSRKCLQWLSDLVGSDVEMAA